MKRIARLVGLPPAHFRAMYGDLVGRYEDLVRSSQLVNHTNDSVEYSLVVAEHPSNLSLA